MFLFWRKKRNLLQRRPKSRYSLEFTTKTRR